MTSAISVESAPRSRLARIVRSKWLYGGLAAFVGLFGLIGFAHTPAGRPLLNALRGAPGCPADLEGAAPSKVESARIAAVSKQRGTVLEGSRRALGFELGVATKSEVVAYMQKHGVACEAQRKDSVLKCSEAPKELSPQGAPRIDDLHLQFDPEQRLVAVDAYRAGTSSCAAISLLKSLDERIASEVGPATATRGEVSEQYLEAGNLRRAAKEYRYQSFVVQVSATRFGKQGVRVREQYQWVPKLSASASTEQKSVVGTKGA